MPGSARHGGFHSVQAAEANDVFVDDPKLYENEYCLFGCTRGSSIMVRRTNVKRSITLSGYCRRLCSTAAKESRPHSQAVVVWRSGTWRVIIRSWGGRSRVSGNLSAIAVRQATHTVCLLWCRHIHEYYYWRWMSVLPIRSCISLGSP